MADNKIANAIKFLKGEEKSLPAAKTEGQVYFAYKNVGTAEKPSYTGAIYIDTPIGGTQNRIKMTANADIADKAFNDSAGLSIRDTYLSSLGYTDDGKQTILIKGSGNNQTRIALPIASTTKSGIVTTDAQSFGGTKTFTTINSTNLTITGSSGFSYTGIETATGDKARPVWFAYDGINGKPVVNANFTYNPATQTLSVANLSGTADKANKDNAGNDIRSTYISNITINNDIMTITKGSGATSTLSIKDKLYSGNKITTKDGLDDFIETNVFKFGHIDPIEGYNGLEKNDGIILSGSWKFSANYGHQIFIDDSGYALRHRYRNDGNWSDWASILDSTNYNSYAPTKTGGGAYGTWDINILGNAASANKLNTNAGSATFPVYFSNGVPVACSTNLAVNITGNAASANKLNTNAGSVTRPVYFSNGIPVQCDGTLANSISGNAATASKLQTTRTITLAGSVTGSAAFDGSNNITITTSTNHSHSQYLPLAGGTMTGPISYRGSKATNQMITFYDNPSDTYGNGIGIGGGGLTIIGGGEATSTVKTSIPNGGNEQMIIANDDIIEFYTHCQDGLGNATRTFIDNSGVFSGTAAKATALTTSAGSSTQPIYFSGGKPVACAYTLSKSVPADAKFTDTWRPLGTTGDTACAGNDSRLSNARPASDVYAWAKDSTKPSYSWGEINGKPSTFTPSNHTHNKLDSLGNIKAETGKTSQSTSGLSMQQAYNNGYPVSYGNVLNLNGQGQGQILVSWAGNGSTPASKMYFRGKTDNNAGDWSSWNEVIDSSNIGSQSVNYANSAGSVAWVNISGKPSTFTPSSHEHSYVLDVNNGSHTTFAYSKAGMNYGDYTLLAAWNGNELRAVNKSQFATASHTHPYLPLAGGTMTGNINYNKAGVCYIGNGANDNTYMVGGALNNLVISSWWGISFTTSCSSDFLNKNAVSIDCRNGVLAAASLRVGNGSGSTINFCTNGGTANPGAKIVAYNDRIEFVFA